ncbi:hypothetical protein PF011_g30755 [Phytophthora fragariae]|uniref:Reverse transcriptase Ty1/copia-type domain-containing protein n=1 Tax=Phytophthora fragariae TaxID=53985 RepID=A0A6A3GPA2_9STRA|nr:hypothetical protein PF011_g30755 [Phytophthora fragariae]
MGTVKYLLGVEILINKTRKQIVYSQRQYVLGVLKRFHMENCNGSATPEATTPSSVEVPATKKYLPYRGWWAPSNTWSVHQDQTLLTRPATLAST